MGEQTIRDLQKKILEIMVFIDNVCRKYNIEYFIMGGTALGAKRHGGFIPWDDDLDIFMTPDNYRKFKEIFYQINDKNFVLQEWKIVDKYLEYAKVRMNNTTFIEENYKNCTDIHHGIYVDIMILHKCPNNKFVQKCIYYASKYVTLVALSQRNWVPKNNLQKICLKILKFLPNKLISNICYKLIYKYDNKEKKYSYCYFITKAKFNQGIFEAKIFDKPKDIKFEGINLKGPADIDKYLTIRYGDYMKMPSLQEQKATVHAFIFDTECSYEKYLNC